MTTLIQDRLLKIQSIPELMARPFPDETFTPAWKQIDSKIPQPGIALVQSVHKNPVGSDLPRGCITENFEIRKNGIYNTEQHGDKIQSGNQIRAPNSVSMTEDLEISMTEIRSETSVVHETPHGTSVDKTPQHPIPSTRSPAPPQHVKTKKFTSYPRDRLDAHIEAASAAFKAANSWGSFIRGARGRGDLHPDVGKLNHPAAHLLSRYQKSGTPAVISSCPWTPDRLKKALQRGPHQSAKNGISFLREEYADMMDKQQWTVLPAHLVLGLPGLRLSPLGLVSQRERRDRMISDYSFYGVNLETLKLAPAEAMQFGRTLKRLLTKIHHANDHFGPVHLSKIDLSDGFYRLWLRADDTAHLAVVFPTRPGEPPLIGIPLTNPMGWTESPPNFCACTETVADLANAAIATPGAMAAARHQPHPLDVVSETPPPRRTGPPGKPGTGACVAQPSRQSTTPSKTPLHYVDVYVDDFLAATQGNKWTRRSIKRLIFQALDKVFRPLDSEDSPFRQDPASIKKLLKGDGTWDTIKIILGWLVNTVDKTITLPPHRVERLRVILASILPGQAYVPTKHWHQVLGELRSMSIAIPGATGLFSLLQEAFRHEEPGRHRLRLTTKIHGFLDDFRWLANDIAARPTRIAELVPDSFPATLGACDAAGTGMGGIHFIPDANGAVTPILWRAQFPLWVQRRLVSFDNPTGDITNSDLELAGSVAHNDVLAQFADVAERTVHSSYDNMAAVFWQRKGATTTTGPAAYLLRLQALHQRAYRYVPLRDYIPGPDNAMADDLSRRWDLSDTQLLLYFNTHYPQDVPWCMRSLRPSMNSNLILALSRRPCARVLLQHTPDARMRIGNSGFSSVCRSTLTRTSSSSTTPSHTSKSSASATATAESPPAASPSALARYRTPCGRSARSSPAWGPLTHERPRKAIKTTESLLNFGGIEKLTPPPCA